MRTAVRFLPLVAAVAIGAGVGHFVVSEWVMPRPPEFAAWKARRGGSKAGGGGNGVIAKGVAARGERGIGGAEKVSSDGLPRKHRWIAEAKVGPYRQQAVRVAGVNDDGSPRVVRIGMGEARRGFAAAAQNSARRGAKAPLDERWARLEDHSSGGGGGSGSGENDELPPGVCRATSIYRAFR